MAVMHADGTPLVAYLIRQSLALLMRSKNPQDVMTLVATVLEPLIATDALTFTTIVDQAAKHGAGEELQTEAFQKELAERVAALQVWPCGGLPAPPKGALAVHLTPLLQLFTTEMGSNSPLVR